jgi:hypothetical protein
MNVDNITTRVQSLCDDTEATPEFCTRQYVLGHLNQAYDDVMLELDAADAAFDEEVVEIPNLPAGTHDLSSYGATSQPLERLIEPYAQGIEWKRAGDPDTSYAPVRKQDVKADVEPQEGISGFEYRGAVIYLTPSSSIVDLRIRGLFEPADLTTGESEVRIPSLGFVLAYKVAELIGIAKGVAWWADRYGRKASEATQNLANRLCKNDQGVVRRFGSTMHPGRRGRGMPGLKS